MMITAQFEPDFMTQIAESKRQSLDALSLGGLCGQAALIVTQPRNIAWLDAIHYVATRFPGCDRRRRKREYKKAMKKALAGTLPGPGLPVTITQKPIYVSNSFETDSMDGTVTADHWGMLGVCAGHRAVITWSQRPGGHINLAEDPS